MPLSKYIPKIVPGNKKGCQIRCTVGGKKLLRKLDRSSCCFWICNIPPLSTTAVLTISLLNPLHGDDPGVEAAQPDHTGKAGISRDNTGKSFTDLTGRLGSLLRPWKIQAWFIKVRGLFHRGVLVRGDQHGCTWSEEIQVRCPEGGKAHWKIAQQAPGRGRSRAEGGSNPEAVRKAEDGAHREEDETTKML